jgi:hypothetical protein
MTIVFLWFFPGLLAGTTERSLGFGRNTRHDFETTIITVFE